MVDQANTVEVELRLEDLATRELRQFTRRTRSASREATRSFDRVGRAARRASTGIGTIAAAAGAAFALFRSSQGLIRSGFGFVEAASALEEANSKFEVLFGEAAPRASQEIDRLALALGRARGTIVGAAADFQGLLVPLGFLEEDAADISLSLTALAQDLESFNNVPVEQALSALRAGLIGSSEPLLRFGVDVREASVQQEALAIGLGNATGELTQQEKILARISIINRATARAQGDVVRTADQFANSSRALNESIKQVRAEIGGLLIPILADAIQELGGADDIANDLRLSFTAVAFATVGFVRAGVALVKAGREIVQQFGGTAEVLELVGRAVAAAVQGFENLIATIRLLGDISVTSFTFLRDSAVTAFAEILRLVNATTAALNDFANFAGLDLGLNEGIGQNLIDSAESANTILTELRTNASEAFQVYSDRVEQATANNAELIRTFDRLSTSVIGLITRTDVDDIVPDFAEFTGLLDRALSAPLSRAEAAVTSSATAAQEATAEWTAFGFAITTVAEAAAETQVAFANLPPLIQGAAVATERYGQTLSDFQLGQDAALQFFNTLENGLATFSRDLVRGEADFGEFARNIIQDIGAIIVQFLLLRSIRGALGFDAAGGLTGGGLAGLFGAAQGGVMGGPPGSPLPTQYYANGGIANSPQVAVFGEGRGAEAFVPLPDGRSIPVTMEGGGRPVQVNLTVNSLDPTTAADVIKANSREITTLVANAIEAGQDRKLVKAVGRA